MPQHKIPAPGGTKFIILVDRSLVIITIYLVYNSLIYSWEKKKIFKEIIHFYYMPYMVTPKHKNPCPVGHEIYNFSRPFLGHH